MIQSLTRYSPPDASLWTGRPSNEHEYLHEMVECIDLRLPAMRQQVGKYKEESNELENCFVILGYCCDAGVLRNQGRPGAFYGPQAIRKQLAKRANHLHEYKGLVDGGDIICEDDNLEETQAQMSALIEFVLKQGGTPIVLGGGHDLAYAHGKAVYAWKDGYDVEDDIAILNVDAHLDLRDLVDGKGHSGSPFYQLFKDGADRYFDYFCFGLQPMSNPPSLMKRMIDEVNGVYITAADAAKDLADPADSTFTRWLTDGNKLVYLTIDLDAIASAYAPGVSAPSAMGLDVATVRKLISLLRMRYAPISIDIVEHNPKYDQDGRTAQLAAGLICDLIYRDMADPDTSF
ncbi:MAG: formimidoylglutamase [Bacteroidota bacterium]